MTVALYSSVAPPLRALLVTPEELEQPGLCIERAKEACANTLAVITYAHGHTFFPSAVREDFGLPPLAPRFSPASWEALVEEALEEQLGLIAVVDVLSAGSLANPFLRFPFPRRFRQWLAKEASGKTVVSDEERRDCWLEPWNSKVRNYLALLLAELCQSYPIDALWVRGWHFPPSIESRVVLPNFDNLIKLPPPEGEEEDDLEAELNEPPYDSISPDPYEEAIARLVRALRSRSRRGAAFPPLILDANLDSWKRAHKLVDCGLAEGIYLASGVAHELIKDIGTRTRGVLWLGWEDDETSSSPEDLSLLAAATGVIIPAERSGLLSSIAEREKVITSTEIPEFSRDACWSAVCEGMLSASRSLRLFKNSADEFEAIFSRPDFDTSLLPTLEVAAEETAKWLEAHTLPELDRESQNVSRFLAYLRLLLDFYAFGPPSTE